MTSNFGPEYFDHEGEDEFDPTSPELLDDLADDEDDQEEEEIQ
jgi:hypothetical protein